MRCRSGRLVADSGPPYALPHVESARPSLPRALAPLAERQFSRILLIKPSSIGDVLHAIPVLWSLRRRFPNAHLAWLLAGTCAPLLDGHPALDEVILFDRRHYGRIGRSFAASRDFVHFLQVLRRRRFDLVIDLQGLFRSAFITFACGASTRIGFGDAREFGAVFYTHRIPPGPANAHAVQRNLRLAPLLGIPDDRPDFTIRVDPASRDAVAELLCAAGLTPDQPYLAVAPGARWETKRWLADGFARAIDRVRERCGAPAVLLGSPEERDLCDRVAAAARHHPVNLAGRTTLSQWVAALAGARVVLCNDSGAKDVAVATGRGLVTLFGPTNPARTGPWGREPTTLRRDLTCSPCYLRKLSRCRFDHRCMTEITPDEVAARVMDEWRRAADNNVE